ncbi:Protein CutA homolog [Lemmus lemmus]
MIPVWWGQESLTCAFFLYHTDPDGHPGVSYTQALYPLVPHLPHQEPCLWHLLHCFFNCPNEQIAKDVARAILDKKLAASVNICEFCQGQGRGLGVYFWKGEIEESTEILLLIKTKTSKVSRLSTYVRLILSSSLIRVLLSFQRLAHPFEIPEVFSIAMDQGDARYLKWLEEGMKEN